MEAIVKLSGPLFAAGMPDKVRQAIQNAVEEMTELGEQKLAGPGDHFLRPRPGGVYLSVAEAKRGQYSRGAFRSSIHKTFGNLIGRIESAGAAAVYGPWLEGTSSRNQTTRFKGYAAFRRTAQFMEERKGGIVQKWVTKLVGEID